MMTDYYKCIECKSYEAVAFSLEDVCKLEDGYIYVETSSVCSHCGKLNGMRLEYELIPQHRTMHHVEV